MKKKEYLPLHAKILFSVSQEINKSLYWAFSKEEKVNALLEDNYYHRNLAKKLNTEQEVLQALEAGAKIDGFGFYFFQGKYLEQVLLNGNKEQISFFVKNNKSLIGDYRLGEINDYLPKLSEDIISIVFTGSNTFGIFNPHDFEKTIEIIKDHPQATHILSSYLMQRKNTINNEFCWISVRSNLLKYFPNKLNDFSILPIMQDYLASLEQKPDPFLDTDIVNTIYLRINCEILQKAYPFSFGTFQFYNSSFKNLIKALDKNPSDNGIVKVHVNDSRPGDTGYQYTHIYINLNEKSKISQNDIKELVHEYYGDYLKTLNEDKLSNLDELTEKWVKSKLLYNNINKDISVNEPIVKRTVKV
jgi:hypothetical protein